MQKIRSWPSRLIHPAIVYRCFTVTGLCLLASGCAQPAASPTADLRARLAAVEAQRLCRAESETNSPLPSGLVRRMELPSDGTRSPAALFAEPLRLAVVEDDRSDAHGLLPTFGETLKRDVRNMPHDLWEDTKRVYGNPTNLAILGGAYAAALTLQEAGPDDTVEHHYDRHHTFRHDWPDALGAAGSPFTHLPLAAGAYLLASDTHNDKLYEVSKTMISALLINDASVLLGYTATWDHSPNGEWGAFPSGHVSSTFVVASVLHEAYGPLAGLPVYGLGTLVAIERLDDREHYLSDVVFGAVMGTVIGHAVASGHDPEVFGWKILPYADPQARASGVALYKSLP